MKLLGLKGLIISSGHMRDVKSRLVPSKSMSAFKKGNQSETGVTV
jgi:hypothetical protein